MLFRVRETTRQYDEPVTEHMEEVEEETTSDVLKYTPPLRTGRLEPTEFEVNNREGDRRRDREIETERKRLREIQSDNESPSPRDNHR